MDPHQHIVQSAAFPPHSGVQGEVNVVSSVSPSPVYAQYGPSQTIQGPVYETSITYPVSGGYEASSSARQTRVENFSEAATAGSTHQTRVENSYQYGVAPAVGGGLQTGVENNYQYVVPSAVSPQETNSYQYGVTSAVGHQETRVDNSHQYGGSAVYPTGTGGAYQINVVSPESSAIQYKSSGYQVAGGVSPVSSGYQVSQAYTSTREGTTMAGESSIVGRSSQVIAGQERVISTTEHLGERVIVGYRYEDRLAKRQKKQLVEEVVDEDYIVRDKIVEYAQPIIREEIKEIPEYEIIHQIHEVPTVVQKEIIVHKDEIVHNYVERPVIKEIERVHEEFYDDIKYVPVPEYKTVQVEEIREEVVYIQTPVPQEVLVPKPREVEVEVNREVKRNIPIAVEAVVAYEFRIPKLKGHYSKVTYPVYLPRFIEMPIAAELYNATITSKAQEYLTQISSLTRTAASLCDIENLANSIIHADLITQCNRVDVRSAVLEQFNAMRLS